METKTMATIKYLANHYPGTKYVVNEVRRGMFGVVPGQGRDGYGGKISTDYMALINGRRHRVYLMCYSNSGTLYVLIKGERYIVCEYDIKENLL